MKVCQRIHMFVVFLINNLKIIKIINMIFFSKQKKKELIHISNFRVRRASFKKQEFLIYNLKQNITEPLLWLIDEKKCDSIGSLANILPPKITAISYSISYHHTSPFDASMIREMGFAPWLHDLKPHDKKWKTYWWGHHASCQLPFYALVYFEMLCFVSFF